jgi:NAD(P)-dependent dehydrogenase (short-subunit alcohol dehydrogenase family)
VFIKCDAAKLNDIPDLATHIRVEFGRVDVLFVNAGVCRFRPIEEVDEAFFDDTSTQMSKARTSRSSRFCR